MYVIDQYGNSPIFQINNHIGFDDDVKGENGEIILKGDGQGIDGRMFSREFFETDALRPNEIITYTNSMGGDVQQSLDMFTAIARAKSRTKSIIAGFAYSCAGWIPLAADFVEMTTNSRWMCHMPYNPKSPDEHSEFLDTVVDIIATTIADKSGRNGKPKKTKSQIIDMMKNETYLTAKQMYDEGLINEIITPSGLVVNSDIETNVDFNYKNFKEIKTFYKQKQSVLNNFLNHKTSTKMAKFPSIVNRLNAVKSKGVSFNLSDDASEEEIVASIAKMENRLNAVNIEKTEMEDDYKTKLAAANSVSMDREKRIKELESEAKNAKDEMEKEKAAKDSMTAKCSELETAMNKIKAENEDFKKKDSDAESKLKREKAENLVKQYDLRISATNKEEKDKAINKWIEKAVNDYEGTELMLDSIATKIKFPRPEDKNENRKSNNQSEETVMGRLEKQMKEAIQNRRKLWKQPVHQ